MKTILLKRIADTDQGAFGVILDDLGKPWMLTCERPWLHNAPLVSCIPTGTYTVQWSDHPRHGLVYQVMNVEYRDDILIHAGNTMKDTEGCILVGRSFGTLGNQPAILSSRDALDEFNTYFNGETFNLRIVEAL